MWTRKRQTMESSPGLVNLTRRIAEREMSRSSSSTRHVTPLNVPGNYSRELVNISGKPHPSNESLAESRGRAQCRQPINLSGGRYWLSGRSRDPNILSRAVCPTRTRLGRSYRHRTGWPHNHTTRSPDAAPISRWGRCRMPCSCSGLGPTRRAALHPRLDQQPRTSLPMMAHLPARTGSCRPAPPRTPTSKSRRQV